MQTFDGGDWVTTRSLGINTDGFQLTMQEEEKLNSGSHNREKIGWLAIDSCAATDGITGLQAATTGMAYTHLPKAVCYSSAFSRSCSDQSGWTECA